MTTKPWETRGPKEYAGVGARDIPAEPRNFLYECARALRDLQWTCRSGGARGADHAFWQANIERRPPMLELYLPRRKWRGHYDCVVLEAPTSFAMACAANHYPRQWYQVQTNSRDLLARTSHVVLGPEILRPKPVQFVLCWTQDGAIAGEETTVDTGGTGQTIRVASFYGVPVFNVQRADHRALWEELLR